MKTLTVQCCDYFSYGTVNSDCVFEYLFMNVIVDTYQQDVIMIQHVIYVM